MLKHVEEQRGKWHYGADHWESAQARAEQLVAEVLRTEGGPEEQIARWR